jgi:hypothetical protein
MSDMSALDPTLKNNVASKLRQHGFAFERDRALGGLRADSVITLLNGEVVVVEVKPWQPTRSNVQRATQQVERYQRGTRADRAFLVLQELPRQPRDSLRACNKTQTGTRRGRGCVGRLGGWRRSRRIGRSARRKGFAVR